MAALLSTISTPICTFTHAKLVSPTSSHSNARNRHLLPVACTTSIEQNASPRRSGNYPPTIWHDDYLQSITTVYTEESHKRQSEELKEDVRLMLAEKEMDRPSEKIKLMDRPLGISQEGPRLRKPQALLQTGFEPQSNPSPTTDTSEHRVEVFSEFKDETGNFKSFLLTDTKGLLSLYEASYLSIQGESILDEARVFAAKHLAENLNLNNMDKSLPIMVRHALEMPIHWRMPRQETRWFIESRHESYFTSTCKIGF